MEKKFDKKKYDIEFHKKNYKQFKVDLKIDFYNNLCELLKEKNLTKVDFVKKAYEELKNK